MEECWQNNNKNLLKVPETFALKISEAADTKLHFLVIEILSMCSITCQRIFKNKQKPHMSLMQGK